jgi:hypothetical protein
MDTITVKIDKRTKVGKALLGIIEVLTELPGVNLISRSDDVSYRPQLKENIDKSETSGNK